MLSTIVVWKTSSQTAAALPTTCDFILWYARNLEHLKYRQILLAKDPNVPDSSAGEYKSFWKGFGDYLTEKQARKTGAENLPRFRPSPTTSQSGSETTRFAVFYNGTTFSPGPGGWKTNLLGFSRLAKADRLIARDRSISYVRFLDDFPVVPISDLWTDVRWGFNASEKRYVVETKSVIKN
jgi:adenine-specific DNA-methyltransferase